MANDDPTLPLPMTAIETLFDIFRKFVVLNTPPQSYLNKNFSILNFQILIQKYVN